MEGPRRKKIEFNRESADDKKIRLAFWSIRIVNLCLADLSEKGWNESYHLEKRLKSEFPATLTERDLKDLGIFAETFFRHETYLGHDHFCCCVRGKKKIKS